MTGSLVVTGGAQGVGWAIVDRLAADGAVIPVDGGCAARGADPEER